MKGIINGFSFIINLFKSIVDMFMYIIKSIITMFRIIGGIINIIFELMNTLPYWLTAFISVTLMVSVLYIIVGRNPGKSD